MQNMGGCNPTVITLEKAWGRLWCSVFSASLPEKRETRDTRVGSKLTRGCERGEKLNEMFAPQEAFERAMNH